MADELDSRRLIRVLLFKLHHKPECSILKWRVRGSDDDGVPNPRLAFGFRFTIWLQSVWHTKS